MSQVVQQAGAAILYSVKKPLRAFINVLEGRNVLILILIGEYLHISLKDRFKQQGNRVTGLLKKIPDIAGQFRTISSNNAAYKLPTTLIRCSCTARQEVL